MEMPPGSAGTAAAPRTYRAYASDDVVTGEAVAVELPVASLVARVGAGLIDLVVNGIVAVTTLTAMGVSITDEALGYAAAIAVLVASLVGIPALSETLSRGKTLGKWALGMRTVRDDGGPITGRHAMVRALVGWVEIYLTMGMPALVSGLVTARVKRLGDFAAGTYVVRERSRLALPRPAVMPAWLADWASSADLASLPPGLSLAIRQFLQRAGTIHPQSRARMSRELLDTALRHVSPPPPADQHPEVVLTAIMAERSRRDAERITRADDIRARVLGPDPLP